MANMCFYKVVASGTAAPPGHPGRAYAHRTPGRALRTGEHHRRTGARAGAQAVRVQSFPCKQAVRREVFKTGEVWQPQAG
jgi:hypothetical protein